MVFLNYLKSFILKTKLRVRDFVFVAIILFLIFGVNHHHDNITSNTIPTLTQVEHKVDKKGVEHSIAPETIISKVEMKDVTKDIKKNLNTSIIKSVTKDVVHLDLKTPEIPVTLTEMDNIVTDKYKTKDIEITHTYNISKKLGQFNLNVTPDTVTFIRHTKTHWFKADENKIDIVHTNELFKDELAMSYSYKEPRVSFVIGPSFGIQYNFVSKKAEPYLGVGITWNMIGLKSKH